MPNGGHFLMNLNGLWRSHWLVGISMRIGSGAALVFAANVVSTLSLFAVTIAIGRLSGATSLGRYGLIVVLGSFFGGIIDFGTDRVLTERLAQRSPHWPAAWWAVLFFKSLALSIGLIFGVLALRTLDSSSGLLIGIQSA